MIILILLIYPSRVRVKELPMRSPEGIRIMMDAGYDNTDSGARRRFAGRFVGVNEEVVARAIYACKNR